jgi:hypothetical protein
MVSFHSSGTERRNVNGIIVPEFHDRARAYGEISPLHVGRNLYYLFLKAPDPVFLDESRILRFPYLKPDPWGMSVLISSPYIFLLLWQKLKTKTVRALLIVALLVALPILGLYATGYSQYSYRYALEFLPYLHTALVLSVSNFLLTKRYKILIALSSLLNLYLFISLISA